jgi:transcription antitermination factor NusG
MFDKMEAEKNSIIEKKWFALYTKPRWEKKVHERLVRNGINSWCPIQRIQKQWSDRKKIIEEPLFRSYVFVNIDYSEDRLKVLMVDGVLNFVHYLGKPAIIRNIEIENIQRYLNEKDATVELRSLEGFKSDTKVKITQGVFMDKEGTVLREGKKKVYVQLESIGQVMVVEFSVAHLEAI